MRTSLILLTFVGCFACGKESGDGPVPPRPPSTVARLAAQACACATLECVQPLRVQIERIIAAEHAGANAAKDNAEATAKLQQCAQRLAEPTVSPEPVAPKKEASGTGW
jgi:hypothetical protein